MRRPRGRAAVFTLLLLGAGAGGLRLAASGLPRVKVEQVRIGLPVNGAARVELRLSVEGLLPLPGVFTPRAGGEARAEVLQVEGQITRVMGGQERRVPFASVPK